MVRVSRLLWDNPSLNRSDADRLRRLEDGDDDRTSPLPPRSSKRSGKRNRSEKQQGKSKTGRPPKTR